MPSHKEFSSYSASFFSTVNEQNQQVRDRLALYQVFLRVYEQNRDLLNGILELEHSGNRLLPSTTLAYVQGVVLADAVYLVTNLLQGKTQAISFSGTPWTIGRDSRSAMLPVADRRLSRRHASIAYNEAQQQFELTDLNSTNGTFVNEEQIVKPHSLQDGDRIRLGGVSFTFFTYHLSLRSEKIAFPCDDASESEADRAAEGQKQTAGLDSSPEQRKSLSESYLDEDTMMVLKPLRSHNS